MVRAATAHAAALLSVVSSVQGFLVTPHLHRTAQTKHLLHRPPLLSLKPVEFPLNTPLQEPVGGDEHDEDEDPEFNMNVGRAMDYLAVDVPHMFSAPPRLEIFCSNVVLKDPIGELVQGRRLYGALHTSLRVLGAITAAKPRVGVSSICYSKSKKVIELKWTLAANSPFMGESTAVQLSAVSLYSFNKEGLIREHAIDNRIKRDLWEYSHSWMKVMITGNRPPPIAKVVDVNKQGRFVD